MNVISTEWTPEERLKVIKGIALNLQNNIRIATMPIVYDATEKIYFLSSQTKYFLEINRKELLSATNYE